MRNGKLINPMLIICGAIFSLVFATVNAKAADLEKPTVTIALASTTSFYFLPTVLAKYLGYYEEEGLSVEFLTTGSGSRMMQALVARNADIANGALDHTIQLRAKGIPLTSFILEGKVPGYVLGIIKKKMPNYSKANDLIGKKVGIAAPGGGLDIFLRRFLSENNVDYHKVSVIGVGVGEGAIVAARSGELDAIANLDPVIGTLQRDGDIRVIVDTRTSQGSKQIYGANYPSSTLIAYSDFIKKNPKTIQAVTNAVKKTLVWLTKATPDEIISKFPSNFVAGNPTTFKAILANTLQTYSPDGHFPEDSAKLVYSVLSGYLPAVKAAKIPLSETFTNKFVENSGG